MALGAERRITITTNTRNLGESEAFPLTSIRRDISPILLRELLTSYLGEYRYELTKDSFSYHVKENEGKLSLEDRDGNNIVDIALRGVRLKQRRGLSTYKEEADVAGSIRLEELIYDISGTDTVLWASPIDARAGYTYGFISFGSLAQVEGEEIFQIITYRVDPKRSQGNAGNNLHQYNEAFSNLTGAPVTFSTPNEFIENPIIIPGNLTTELAEQILNVSLGVRVSERERNEFNTIILQMNSHINEFIKMFKSNIPTQDLQKAFYALENYFLKLKLKQKTGVKYQSLDRFIGSAMYSIQLYPDVQYESVGSFGFAKFIEEYGRVIPPVVSGSCGKSSQKLFTSIIDELTKPLWNENSTILETTPTDTYTFDHTGTCKRCKGEHKRLGPCDLCEKCDQELK